MNEKKKKNEGRFICVVDIDKSPTARQAYFFLKGLGSLRQDIIIDMVQNVLGDDLNKDLEHMTRGELMSLYYGKKASEKDLGQGVQMVTPAQSVQAMPAMQMLVPTPQQQTVIQMPPAMMTADAATIQKIQEDLMPTNPVNTASGQNIKDDIHEEQGLQPEQQLPTQDESTSALRSAPAKSTGFSRTKQIHSFKDDPIFETEEEVEDISVDADESDDDDLLEDDASSVVTEMINNGFADI